MSPLLTISIPTYNRANLLRETLESVFAQAGKDSADFEVIVIDNHSTDKTPNLMAELLKSHDNLLYIRKDSNSGIDANILSAMQSGSGEYVYLISDDDILLPGTLDYLRSICRKEEKFSFAFLNGGIFSGSDPADALKSPIFCESAVEIYTDRNLFIEKIWVWSTFISSFVLNRKTFNLLPTPEKHIGTDILLSYVLFDLISVIPEQKMLFLGRIGIAVRTQFTGNYRVFYAFAFQWGTLLMDYAPALGFDEKRMSVVFAKSIRQDLFPRLLEAKKNEKVRIGIKDMGYIFRKTWPYRFSWLVVYPTMLLPSPAVRLIARAARQIGISKIGNVATII